MKKNTYNHLKIEKKWQEKWKKDSLYVQKEKAPKGQKIKKCYVLDMFPYPSGQGLHVGHPKGYIATDVYSRFKAMNGYSVLHPMGWDAFGLPAENYAIKNKIHPSVAVKKNIKRFKEQLAILGFSYDWNREVDTTDPEYYKWTQWAFLKMWEKGLAFESFEPINWCPSCKTGLANEDLEKDGTCERCGSVVEKKPMRQWVLKITKYADRLLKDLDTLKDWPNSIKESQRNWIGRSEGAEITFKIKDTDQEIKVFTTRPDTLFGVTYVVLAPENKMVAELLEKISNKKEVEKYIETVKGRAEIERTAEGKEKTGIELKGLKAINPVNNEEVPVLIADYVLATYGTGAVMAVPAHDERDYAFASKYKLPIKYVVEPKFVSTNGEDAFRPGEKSVYRNVICAVVRNPKDDSYLCISWKDHVMNGLVTGGIDEGEDVVQAARREVLEETGYKNLRHIKSEPLAINTFFYHRIKQINRHAHFNYVFFDLENDERVTVPESESSMHDVVWKKRNELKEFLTVFEGDYAEKMINGTLKAYIGDGILVNSGSLNGKSNREAFDEIVKLAGGKKTKNYRLQDWVFSRQRYWGEPIPLLHCEKCGIVPVPEKELPVVLPNVKSYEPTGTGESPLASISKWVNTKCPKCKGPAKRETNTMPQWAGSCWYYLRYMDPKNKKALVDPKKEKYWAPVDMYVGGAEHATRHLIYARFWHKFLYDIGVVSTKEPFSSLRSVGLIMGADGRKMSKRFGNVVNPDDVVKTFGADTLRVYEMFMGPFEGAINWSTDSMVGARRFIERVWNVQNKVDKKAQTDKDLMRIMHQSIKKVGEDIESFSMNTAISALMIFLNEIEKKDKIPVDIYQTLLKLLAPFAPHMVDEIAVSLGSKKSLYLEKWPEYNKKMLIADTVKIAIQVNGKLRGVVEVSNNSEEDIVKREALKIEAVAKWVEGKEIKKVIYIKNKLINILL